MAPNFKKYKQFLLVLVGTLFMCFGFSQNDTSVFKAQFALGINSPSNNGFIGDFESNTINFPSINLGVQYMFKPLVGVKLDFGYNRFSNLEDTPGFKVNYTRINAQFIYDANRLLYFLPERIGVFVHAGPGISMIKPLGNYGENNKTFLNAMAGIEFHYGISDTLSVFLDMSYISSFSGDFKPMSSGFGSFNGNLLTITIGASISLSGCYFCNQ